MVISSCSLTPYSIPLKNLHSHSIPKLGLLKQLHRNGAVVVVVGLLRQIITDVNRRHRTYCIIQQPATFFDA